MQKIIKSFLLTSTLLVVFSFLSPVQVLATTDATAGDTPVDTSYTPPSAGVTTTGKTILLNNTVNVRQNSEVNSTILGAQLRGATGTVVDGPIVANNFTWWKIDYATGVDGWSVENYMVPSGSNLSSGENNIYLSAVPATISQGQSSTLVYSPVNATSCTLRQGSLLNGIFGSGTQFSAVKGGGVQVVSPQNTSTYTLTCTGLWAGAFFPSSASKTVTVTVGSGQAGGTTPSANCSIDSFTATPPNLSSAGTVNLNWNSTNCSTLNINGGIYKNDGAALNSVAATPATVNQTTTYTLTGQPGNIVKSLTVTVGTPPVTPNTFSVGDNVKATRTLNVRSSADTSATIVASVLINRVGKILEGPISADGYTWWKINFGNGVSGWSAESLNGVAYLVKTTLPVIEDNTGTNDNTNTGTNNTGTGTKSTSVIQLQAPYGGAIATITGSAPASFEGMSGQFGHNKTMDEPIVATFSKDMAMVMFNVQYQDPKESWATGSTGVLGASVCLLSAKNIRAEFFSGTGTLMGTQSLFGDTTCNSLGAAFQGGFVPQGAIAATAPIRQVKIYIPKAYNSAIFYTSGVEVRAAGTENNTNTSTNNNTNTSNTDTALGCVNLSSVVAEGSSGADVILLQKFLKAKGLLSGDADGKFGPKTAAAVSAFQIANGIEPVGSVGPITRAKIAEVSCGTSGGSSNGSTSGGSTSGANSGESTGGSTGSNVTLKANNTLGRLTVALGTPVSISWSVSGQTSCYKSSTPPSEFTGSLVPLASGSVPVYPTGEILYKITCGSSYSSVVVNVGGTSSSGASGSSGSTGGSSNLSVGNKVRSSLLINVRSSANNENSSNIINAVQASVEGSIIDGPISATGHTWWKVSFNGGATGWVAGEYLTLVTSSSTTGSSNTGSNSTNTDPMSWQGNPILTGVSGLGDIKFSTDGVNFSDGPAPLSFGQKMWFKGIVSKTNNSCFMPTPPESGGIIGVPMASYGTNSFTLGPVSYGNSGYPFSADFKSISYKLVCNNGVYDGKTLYLADSVVVNFAGQNPVSTSVSQECTSIVTGNPKASAPQSGYPWGSAYMSGNPKWRDIEWRIQNGVSLLPSDLARYYTEYYTAMGFPQYLTGFLRSDGTPFAGPGGIEVPAGASVSNGGLFPTYDASSGVFDYQINQGFLGSTRGATTEAWFSPFSSPTRVVCPANWN